MGEPDNTNDSNRCSADEKARLTKVNALALGYIQKALGNYDEATFRKWFGVNNADQPDISVKTRIRQTYEFMKTGYQSKWDVLCCSGPSGACEHCTDGTMAYVMASSWGGDALSHGFVSSEIFMRVCDMTLDDNVMSLTLFHELMHMTSIVSDHAYDRTE